VKTGIYHVVFRGSLLGIITPCLFRACVSPCVLRVALCLCAWVPAGRLRRGRARRAGATRCGVEDHVCVRVAVWITAV